MSSPEPRILVENAADAGMKAIREHLAHADAEVDTLLILLSIKGGPPEEPAVTTAADNVEDGRDVLSLLGAHFIEASKQMGLKVQLVPWKQIGEG